jgi:hypothetical protein
MSTVANSPPWRPIWPVCGRKCGDQAGHPGSWPKLMPIERIDAVVEHHLDACRRCGSLLEGEYPRTLAPLGD